MIGIEALDLYRRTFPDRLVEPSHILERLAALRHVREALSGIESLDLAPLDAEAIRRTHESDRAGAEIRDAPMAREDATT